CTNVARFLEAIDVVRGIPFGQTCTQFCAFRHPIIPPSSMSPSSTSPWLISLVGCAVNNLACESADGPISDDLSFTLGQASKQTPQVIHLDNSYADCCFSCGTRGPGPKSYVPSIGTQALICFKASNIFSRSTYKSRMTGK